MSAGNKHCCRVSGIGVPEEGAECGLQLPCWENATGQNCVV